jgi:hypothetical protein
MAVEQTVVRGGKRRRGRVIGVCALLAIAWLAGRGFMAGGEPRADADADAAAAAGAQPPPHGAAAGPAAPTSAPDAAPAPHLEGSPRARAEAAPEAGLEPDRFASLRAAVAVHADRGELAAAAAAWRHLLGLPLSAAQREALAQAVAPAQRAAAACLEQAAALLAAGRARAAVQALAPLRQPHGDAAQPLDLMPAAVADAVAAWLRAELEQDAALPAPMPMARGRTLTAWLADASVRGVCVAADAETVTVQVRRADGAAFPMAAYADCEPDDPTGAEAVELGFAAARRGDALLARAWALVAAGRGAAATPRCLRLAAALR